MQAAIRTTSETSSRKQSITILVVEDEQDLLDLLEYNLSREGYEVVTSTSGETGLRLVKTHQPDLVVLDLMLPGMDGLEVCRSLRATEPTADLPIIMLTAKGEETDIVRGLELGADDYITKPFSPRVLSARIAAVLRRAESGQSGDGAVIRAGQIAIDPQRHEVLAGAEPVELTATEFKLITLLATRPGRVFTRQQIIDAIHDGYAAVTDRSVDVQIVSLRRKLGKLGHQIETVRGVGYRVRDT